MKILIIGCGAIGSYYGGKLQQGGAEVCALMRSKFDQAQTVGITIKSSNEEFNFKPRVISKIEDYQDQADYILIATKVLPEIDLVSIIKKVISEKTSLVLIQNGIHIEENLYRSFPNNDIIRCLAFICVSKDSPTFVNHQDYGRLVIGKYPNQNCPKTREIAQIWQKSGVECQISDNIKKETWKKLVWNAPFNPISVLANKATTKELLNDYYSRNLIINVMKDIVTLAESDNCSLEDGLIEQMIGYTETMRPYKTSMLLDYENKRPLEIDAILGNAVKFAENKKIDTPYLKSIYGLLKHFK